MMRQPSAILKGSRHVTVEDPEDLPASVLASRVFDSLNAVRTVAEKSGHLKFSFVKMLKDAAKVIDSAVSVLSKRSTSEETLMLEARNLRLEAEVSHLSKEVAALKRVVSTLPGSQNESQSLPPAQLPRSARPREAGDDELRTEITSLKNMMCARLEAMESRLPAEPRLRPPLAVDGIAKGKAQTSVPSPIPIVVEPHTLDSASESQKEKTEKKTKKGKKGKKKQKGNTTTSFAESSTSGSGPQSIPPVPASQDSWSIVASRGKKKKEKAAASPTSTQIPSSAKKVRSAVQKLRPPTTAAIVLKLLPEAVERGVTYAGAIDAAKKAIVLADLGITSIGIRSTATLDRILEVPGPDSESKADSLAGKLRDVLGADVTVSRPTKCAEMRIVGLDDSVTSEEVTTAIARAANCSVDAIKSGEIRRDSRGQGTVWVKCPVVVAKKVVEAGKLLVGWVSARVKVSEPKPMRCFRCLCIGHASVKCPSEVDRSDACYRCGQSGHKAATCLAIPHCIVCADAKKPADHRLGSASCDNLKSKKKGVKEKKVPKKMSSTTKPPSQVQAGEATMAID